MKKKTLYLMFAVIISLCIVCGVAALGINASKKTNAKTTEQYMQEYGGDPNTYALILTLTDCAILQEQFDQAEANLANHPAGTTQYKWGLGYMNASDDRMKDIGCPIK